MMYIIELLVEVFGCTYVSTSLDVVRKVKLLRIFLRFFPSFINLKYSLTITATKSFTISAAKVFN